MRESQTVDLDGTKFRITQLGARRAHTLLTKTLKALGPALSVVLTDVKSLRELRGALVEAGEASAGDHAWLGKLIERIFENLDESLLDTLMHEMSELTVVTTKEQPMDRVLSQHFDDVFSGRLDLMYRWFYAAWRVNFFSFFGILKSMPQMRS